MERTRETVTEPEEPATKPRTPVAAPPQRILALQRGAGNAAVTRMLARMPTPQALATARTDGNAPDTPYLQGVAQALQRWYQLENVGATADEKAEQLRALADLEARAEGQYALPNAEYEAMGFPVQSLLFDISADAVTERTNRLGQPGYRQPMHDVTREQHVADREQLRRWVDEGLRHPTDRRLRNSCQWVSANPRRVRLFVLTETGDRVERLTNAGKDVDKAAALFPHPYGAGAWDLFTPVPAQVYNHADPLAPDPGVYLRDDTRGTVGWNRTGDVIVILRAAIAKGRDYIWETLRHEVQHDADHAGAEDIDGYKTEYRAYSYEGNPTYDALDNTVASHNEPDPDDPSITYAFTPRQFAIFNTIKTGYLHTQNGWNNNPLVAGGQTFRQAVVAYRDPDTEADNPANSPRLESLYRLAAHVPANGNAGDPQFQTLVDTCFTGGSALDRDDVLDALQPGSPLRNRWTQFVTGAARVEFERRCRERLNVPVTFHLRYFTRPGQNVLVSGSHAALGAWDTGRAVALNHSGHEDWEGTVAIPYARGAATFDYKYFVRDGAGEHWERGGNRPAQLSTFEATQRHDDVWHT